MPERLKTRTIARNLWPATSPEVQFRLLMELSQKISRTLDLQDVLDELLAALRAAIDYDAAGVFVLNRRVPLGGSAATDLIAGMATVGFGPPRPDDPMLRSGKGIIGHVIRTGRALVAPDVSAEPLYVKGRERTLSEIAVPVVSNGQVIGALNLESDRPHAYSHRDVEPLEFFASVAALSIEKALLHREVLEKERIEQQLRIARAVQAGLLPDAPPQLPGYDIAACHLPSQEIGGDYYDYLPQRDGQIGVAIADVSGKGVPAALIMATFRAALRGELRRRRDVHDALVDVNQTLLEAQTSVHFVTAVCGVLEPPSGGFAYVNCGHNPPLLLRAGGGCESLDVGGPALGLLPDQRYEQGFVALRPGDVLCLFTDGVVEPMDATDEEFGPERLEAVLRTTASLSARDSVEAVLEATRRFSGREAYDDDFTLVVLKRVSG
jgi:sigma-B regulation protein RsbU (phosphoserine phosphatase)